MNVKTDGITIAIRLFSIQERFPSLSKYFQRGGDLTPNADFLICNGLITLI